MKGGGDAGAAPPGTKSDAGWTIAAVPGGAAAARAPPLANAQKNAALGAIAPHAFFLLRTPTPISIFGV